MFNQLRQGSQLYILHESANPHIDVGTIENIPNIPIMNIGYFPNTPSFMIDLTIKVGDRSLSYKGLPPNAESAKATNSVTGEDVIIACNKEALNTELQSWKQKSIDHINANGYHEQRIKSIEALILQLNPEVAEKAQQAQEFSDLKSQVSTLASLVQKLTTQLNTESAL